MFRKLLAKIIGFLLSALVYGLGVLLVSAVVTIIIISLLNTVLMLPTFSTPLKLVCAAIFIVITAAFAASSLIRRQKLASFLKKTEPPETPSKESQE